MRLILLLLLLASLFNTHSRAQEEHTAARYEWIKCNPVQQKNFYLLSVFEYEPYCKSVLQNDKELRSLYSRFHAAESTYDLDCKDAPACFTSPMLWDSASIASAGLRLVQLFRSDKKFAAILHRHLRDSKVFMKWASENDEQMLTHAWREEITDVNRIITRYTTNKGLRYPDIDSSSFNVRSAAFKAVIRDVNKRFQPDKPLFFYPSMTFALGLLHANHRDEAARHEPLSKENKEAYERINSTDWNKYPYSAILILGEGPEGHEAISAGCIQRCIRGAALFRQGFAPFIVVSGGYVHPFQTHFSEAIEMRKYLVNKCRIPPAVVIVEPQARHTTTNIRNAARIIFRTGIPADKKILCTSSILHIAFVASAFFVQRNINELGYVPFADMQKVSDSTVSFKPSEAALYWDANDPLDP